MRLHKVGEARDADVFDVLDVEQTVQKVALRFHAVTKGRRRLAILLFHRDDVLVSVSHSSVRRILRKKPIDGVPVHTDGVTFTPDCAIKRSREHHLGIPRQSEDYEGEGLTVCQPCRVASATEGRYERKNVQGQSSRERLLPVGHSV